MVAGLSLALATAVLLPSPAGAGVADEPIAESVTQAVALDRPSVAVGDVVTVELSGWPAGVAQVELCGNAALRATADCDPLGATATRVDADGIGVARVTVGHPPVPCPCVVRVGQTGTGAITSVPIEIAGLVVDGDVGASGTGSVDAVRRIEVVATSVERDEGNSALFGIDARRRVTVTIRNAGTVVLSGVTVTGTLSGWGASSQPVAGPAPLTIEPGSERQVSIAVDLPGPAFGDYRFAGRIDGGDEPVEFSIATSHMPWGLLNGVLVVIAAAAVIAARRSRRSGEAGVRRAADREATDPEIDMAIVRH